MNISKVVACVLLLFATLLISCSKKKDFTVDAAIAQQYPMLFNASPAVISDSGITCAMQLRANAAGDTLFCATLINNSSNDTLRINPYDLQIANKKGIRSDVVWANLKKQVIAPNSSDTVTFKFAPVNNTALFNRTGYRGDMDSIYTITSNFIHINKGQNFFGQSVKFSMEPGVYQKYVSAYAKEKRMRLFKWRDEGSIKRDLITNLKLLNSQWHDKDPSDSVQIAMNDIIAERTLIKLSFFTIDTTLFLNAAIINHGQHALLIEPKQFLIKIGDKMVSPQIISISEAPVTGTTGVLVKSGDRFRIQLAYRNINSTGFSSVNNGIIFKDIGKKLFAQPVDLVLDPVWRKSK